MKWRAHILLLLAGFTASLVATRGAAEQMLIPLVEQGQPKAVIVWDAKAANDPFFSREVEPYIEDHLPWAIEQITGAKLSVVTNAPDGDAPAILIGKSWL